MVKNRNYSTQCPGCGKKTFRGTLGKDEHRKSFICPFCTVRWHITFDYPSTEELEALFERGEIPSGPATRVYGPKKSLFPFRLPSLRKANPNSRQPIFKESKK